MTVSSSTNKVSYAGNSSTTVFAYTFKIFDEDDLTVIIRAANGTETTKTITTHYTVSGVGSAGGGNVTMLTAPATGETLVIIREQDLIQELDIVPNDPFPADSVEAALDKLTFMVQQQQETLNRALKASKTTTISTTEFTQSAASRANKLLSFDSNGDLNIAQELGTYRGNWAASTAYKQRDIVKDGGNDNLYFCNTAHTSTGTLPISTNADVAKWDLLLDVSAFTTLYDQFDDRYLGAKNSDPATDNDGNTLIDGALYWNTTDNRLKVYDLGNTTWEFTAPSPAEQANIDTVAGIAADISTVAAIDSDVTAVAADATAIGTVAGIAADVSAVAAIDSDVTAVAADATDIGTVAADLAGSDTIGTVAGIAANVTTVAGISADVTAVAGDATDIGTVATAIADVSTVAGIAANVTTVAGISANVTTVAGIDSDVTTVAGISANVTTVAGNSANVTTVAGISADVTTVAGISSDVTTVAANVAGVTSFAEKYRVGANDPVTSLDTGDLFYNTSSNLLKVYNGSAWETGVTPGSGFLSASNNLSDVANAATALFNLGLTATAAELNVLDGVTSSTAELNLLDGSSAGTVANSKAVIYDASGGIVATQVDITATGDLRLQDTTGGQYVALQAPGTVSSSFTLTLPAADGTAGQFLKTDGSGALSFDTVSSSVNYPQESKSADYTLVLADAGKQIFHPASDNNLRTFTIPANSSVAFPVGTVVLFTQENGTSSVIKVAINSDTLVTNASTTGSVYVGPGNTLYCVKVTSTKWFGYYMYQSTIVPSPQYYLAIPHSSTPYITAYPLSLNGFGAKFSNPASLPAGPGSGAAFSPAGDAVAVAHSVDFYVSAYPWSSSGFGTKFSNPGTLPTSNGQFVAFSPSGNALAVAHEGSPRISVYSWSGSGFGSKFSNPGTLPADDCFAVSFSPDGNAIAVAHLFSPYIAAYPWSGSGFGTKFSDPASLPAGNGFGIAFSPASDAIAIAHSTSPYITAYAWSGSGFGAKFSNPGTLPTGSGRDVAFSPSGDAIAVAHDTSPYITVYPWSGSGFGTKFSNPSSLPGGNGNGVAFSPSGDIIAVGSSSSPYIDAWLWSGSGFGTKFTNPATLPPGSGQHLDIANA